MTLRLVLVFSLSLLLSCSGWYSDDEMNADSDSTIEMVDSSNSTDSVDEVIDPIEDTFEIDPLMNSTPPDADVTYETYNDPETGWGYKILMDGSVYVNQPHIPAVEGKNGFASEKDAKKTAELVANKV
ncbi:DUF4907 domain-containing protein, partial [Crocinitomix catalasitica]|nr:DUF4907 domain-containing protein [Crocinitomix catalasitica]